MKYSDLGLELKDIPYIRYVITREGIEPEQKKEQGIMDLGR